MAAPCVRQTRSHHSALLRAAARTRGSSGSRPNLVISPSSNTWRNRAYSHAADNACRQPRSGSRCVMDTVRSGRCMRGLKFVLLGAAGTSRSCWSGAAANRCDCHRWALKWEDPVLILPTMVHRVRAHEGPHRRGPNADETRWPRAADGVRPSPSAATRRRPAWCCPRRRPGPTVGSARRRPSRPRRRLTARAHRPPIPGGSGRDHPAGADPARRW